MLVSMPLITLAQRFGNLPTVALAAMVDLMSHFDGHHRSDAPGPIDGEAVFARICDRTTAVGVSCDDAIVTANAYLANLLGYTTHELRGMPLDQVVAGPRPRHVDQLVPFSAVAPHRHKAGHIISLRVSAMPVLAARNRIYWIGTFEPLN